MSVVALVESGAALLSMRNSDFDAYSAFGEVIDNSIQAEASEIKVLFSYTPATSSRSREPIKSVAFGDSGKGMSAEIIHRCLQLGYSSRYNDRKGIGRFGVGATLAAINQCRKIEIYSKEPGGEFLYTYIDLDKITSTPPEMEKIPDPVKKPVPKEFSNLVGDTGTLVIWSKYDRQPDDATKMVNEFRVWTGRTYRKFIWQGVSIVLNGAPVVAIDPLYARTEGTEFPDDPKATVYEEMVVPWPIPPEDQEADGPKLAPITIRMSLLPEEFRTTQGTGNSSTARERHIDGNEGISILRNDREVFFGHIPYWKGEPFKEIDRWWGCEVSFDAILDREFTVKNIKRGAVPVTELKQALAGKINPTRKTALERVREIWVQRKAEDLTTHAGDGVDTGHSDAEHAAKNTPTPKNVLDSEKDPDAETQKFTDEWLKHAGEQQKAAWKAKFQSQPFTIIDEEWRGPEFFETSFLGGNSVLRYNMRHVFFSEIEKIGKRLAESDEDNKDARRLKALIDLLIISYAKSEAMFDPRLEMSVEKFIEQSRMNWGHYLSSYLDVYNRETVEEE
jgi:hypothetical protein